VEKGTTSKGKRSLGAKRDFIFLQREGKGGTRRRKREREGGKAKTKGRRRSLLHLLKKRDSFYYIRRTDEKNIAKEGEGGKGKFARGLSGGEAVKLHLKRS